MSEHMSGPSGPGTVVLELGGSIGALVLETPAEMAGEEIEISPVGGGTGARRTHSMVRARITQAGTSFAAVYPGLGAGRYTLWRRDGRPAGAVSIEGGQVTRHGWPALD